MQPNELKSVLFDVKEGITSYFVYIPIEYELVECKPIKATQNRHINNDCIKLHIRKKTELPTNL